jgi:hypothetical protein
MNTPYEDTSSTTSSTLTIIWDPLTTIYETGNSAITSYSLEWDANTNGVTWSDLVGFSSDDTSTLYSITSGLT